MNESRTTGSTKVCGACGAAFTCCAPEACWCSGVAVKRETLRQLGDDYADCLCPACLQRAAETGSPIPGERP